MRPSGTPPRAGAGANRRGTARGDGWRRCTSWEDARAPRCPSCSRGSPGESLAGAGAKAIKGHSAGQEPLAPAGRTVVSQCRPGQVVETRRVARLRLAVRPPHARLGTDRADAKSLHQLPRRVHPPCPRRHCARQALTALHWFRSRCPAERTARLGAVRSLLREFRPRCRRGTVRALVAPSRLPRGHRLRHARRPPPKPAARSGSRTAHPIGRARSRGTRRGNPARDPAALGPGRGAVRATTLVAVPRPTSCSASRGPCGQGRPKTSCTLPPEPGRRPDGGIGRANLSNRIAGGKTPGRTTRAGARHQTSPAPRLRPRWRSATGSSNPEMAGSEDLHQESGSDGLGSADRHDNDRPSSL